MPGSACSQWRGTNLSHGKNPEYALKTVESTKILGRRVRVERESATDKRALFNKSIFFSGKQKSQVHMEIHYIDSHVLETERFAG